MAKYGLLGDAAFFAWLEENWRAIVAGWPERDRGDRASPAAARPTIVAADEREQSGARALLNLGHTFGHALEAATGYSDRLLHGEAVAIGMVLAFAFSARRGPCSPDDTERVAAHLAAVGLPTAHRRHPRRADGRRDADAGDRPGQEGQPRPAHLHPGHGIGDAFVAHDVPPADVAAFLAEQLAT